MKKFNLPLTTAISAAMLASSACSDEREWQTSNNTRVCVDNSGHRIPDAQCFNQQSNPISPYRWYYISHGGYVPIYGGFAGGGSYMPIDSGSYVSAPASAPVGAVTRGGFGSIGGGAGAAGEGAGE